MTRKLSAALLSGVLCLTLPMADAEAKRLGGSRSFGMQRNTPAQTAPQPSSPSRPETAPAAAPTPAPTPVTPPKTPQQRSWLGPLAGLAAGLGLGALLSHFGLGEGFGTLLLVALLAFGAILLFRILAGRSRPEPRLAYPTAPPASAP